MPQHHADIRAAEGAGRVNEFPRPAGEGLRERDPRVPRPSGEPQDEHRVLQAGAEGGHDRDRDQQERDG